MTHTMILTHRKHIYMMLTFSSLASLAPTMRTLLLGTILFPLLSSAQQTCPALVWSDEFDGTELDATNWAPQIGDGCSLGQDLCGCESCRFESCVLLVVLLLIIITVRGKCRSTILQSRKCRRFQWHVESYCQARRVWRPGVYIGTPSNIGIGGY